MGWDGRARKYKAMIETIDMVWREKIIIIK